MADNLCTPEQLALLMQDTGLDESLATLLLELATGEVQAMAGQRLVQVEDDPFELELYGGSVLVLKERPVTALSDVTIDGTALTEGTDYRRASGSNRIHLSWCGRRLWPSFVAGVYSHGYALAAQGSPDTGLELGDFPLVPAQNAALGLARAVAANPSGVESESIDDYRVSYAASMAAEAAKASNLRAHLQRVYGGGAAGVRVLA